MGSGRQGFARLLEDAAAGAWVRKVWAAWGKDARNSVTGGATPCGRTRNARVSLCRAKRKLDSGRAALSGSTSELATSAAAAGVGRKGIGSREDWTGRGWRQGWAAGSGCQQERRVRASRTLARSSPQAVEVKGVLSRAAASSTEKRTN